MPWLWVASWHAAMSVLTLSMYAWDKRRAHRGEWRIPEAHLHLAELLGGWPGAIIARQMLRHKTRKKGYLLRSWLIVAVHAAVWACVGVALLMRNGR